METGFIAGKLLLTGRSRQVIVYAVKEQSDEPGRAGLLLATSWCGEGAIRGTGKSGPTAGWCFAVCRSIGNKKCHPSGFGRAMWRGVRFLSTGCRLQNLMVRMASQRNSCFSRVEAVAIATMETYPNTVLLRNAVGVLKEEREKRKHAGLFVARGSRLRHSVESVSYTHLRAHET